MRRGVLTRGASIDQWHREYIINLRETAAGRQGTPGALNLSDERAALAKAQREKIDIENARARLELIPLAVNESAWSIHHSVIRSNLLSVPTHFKALFTVKCDAEMFLGLKAIIVEKLEELSHVRLPSDLDDKTRQYFQDLSAAAKFNGNGVGR